MELIEQIALLERALQEHIRKWEMFFSGSERVPPVTDRERINRRLRFLSEQTVNRRAEQFRIEQLQHRFMTYSQNWDRMLREREEGRSVQPHTNPSLRAPDQTNDRTPGSVNEEAGTTLFDRYRAAKTEQGLEMSVDRVTFDRQIAVQREKIEQRLGRKVRFEVQVEDGNVRVVARKNKKKK
jgi:hypothetical protein